MGGSGIVLANTCATEMVAPGGQHCVAWYCGCILLLGFEEPSLRQPADGRLHRAFRNADVFSKLLVTDLDWRVFASMLDGKPQVHQECDRPVVVADKVAHQDVHNVVV